MVEKLQSLGNRKLESTLEGVEKVVSRRSLAKRPSRVKVEIMAEALLGAKVVSPVETAEMAMPVKTAVPTGVGVMKKTSSPCNGIPCTLFLIASMN